MQDDRLARFKREVEAEWRDPVVTAAYRKWDREEVAWGCAARDLLLSRADLRPGQRVLDIGSAHGEPGLAAAEAVGATGHVTLFDLAPDLLAHAAARARAAGLAHVVTQVGDAHALPFPDASFDRITSRLAAMYFADPLQAFREARRVLAPGGLAAWLVWGPFEQPMFRDVIGLLFQYVEPPADEPDAPSPFRFSEAGTLGTALHEAGFADVREESATVPTVFPGTPEAWWEWLVDTAAPVQTWLRRMDEAKRQRAVAEIHAALAPFHDGGGVTLPIDVIVATGRRGL